MPALESNLQKWVIFDGDNTLWNTEQLYDKARQALCTYLVALGAPNAETIEETQRRIDRDLHGQHGYSDRRFALSFEKTLVHFFPNATAAQEKMVGGLAMQVFSEIAEPFPNVDDVLAAIGAEYRIGIITAGPAHIQRRRLSDFAHRDRIVSSAIVAKKTPKVVLDFCQENSVWRERSWVAGDSLLSDVAPALKAGLKAVWVQHHNWKEVENDFGDPTAGGVTTINSIEELVDVILEGK